LPILLFFLRAFVKKSSIYEHNDSPPGAIFELKKHQNVFVVRSLPRISLGAYSALPDPRWFSGEEEERGREGEERREWEGGRKGRGAFPH